MTTTMLLAFLLVLTAVLHSFVTGFTPSSTFHQSRRSLLWSSSSDKPSNNDSFMESLRARQLELDQEKFWLETQWRNAKCTSKIPVSFPDWVRRIDVQYPWIAVGSSSGSIFCANLETGQDVARHISEPVEELDGTESIMRILFSGYDGGGTIAIALRKTLLCAAGRQGSVQIYRLTDQEIIPQGNLKALEGVLVTCLKLDEDYLWVGTADGNLLAYDHTSSELPLALQTNPELEWKFDSSILSLSLSPAVGLGVVSTSKGTVEVFSLDDDDAPVITWTPPLDSMVRQSSNVYILSAIMVPYKDEKGYTLACGCNDGSIYLQPLRYENGMLNESKLLAEQDASPGKSLQPCHSGPVKCLATPAPGLLLSGGQDGSLRVWNVSAEDSHFLYQFVGYKVWLGTLWTDGRRIISDGADNTVILHDFWPASESTKKDKKD